MTFAFINKIRRNNDPIDTDEYRTVDGSSTIGLAAIVVAVITMMTLRRLLMRLTLLVQLKISELLGQGEVGDTIFGLDEHDRDTFVLNL